MSTPPDTQAVPRPTGAVAHTGAGLGAASAVRRVAVFAQLHHPGLGDLIQRNMMLALVRRAYPQAAVALVVGRELAAARADFLENHCYATELMRAPDPFDTDERSWRTVRSELAARGFEVCVVDPGSHTLGACHAREAGIPVRIGYRRGAADDRDLTRPISLRDPVLGIPDIYDYLCALAAVLGIEPPRPAHVVPPLPCRGRTDSWQESRSAAASDPRLLVAVHPVGQPHWNRRWPLRRYAELCTRLAAERDARLCLVGVGAEQRELESIKDEVTARVPAATVAVETVGSLERTAQLVAAADLLIGNDSSLLHIAAAVGTRAVAVLGPTGTQLLWARVYPWHRGVSLGYACQGITHDVDEVAGRVCEHHCVVPYQGPDGPYPRCMTDLAVEQVWDAVCTELAASRRGGQDVG